MLLQMSAFYSDNMEWVNTIIHNVFLKLTIIKFVQPLHILLKTVCGKFLGIGIIEN